MSIIERLPWFSIPVTECLQSRKLLCLCRLFKWFNSKFEANWVIPHRFWNGKLQTEPDVISECKPIGKQITREKISFRIPTVI
ncbi:hypothetical protein A4G99_16685 [Haladaptatus sp. R4]|nr:hypothetical protein A4G99_16685 [Haladaptatus sp. R4]